MKHISEWEKNVKMIDVIDKIKDSCGWSRINRYICLNSFWREKLRKLHNILLKWNIHYFATFTPIICLPTCYVKLVPITSNNPRWQFQLQTSYHRFTYYDSVWRMWPKVKIFYFRWNNYVLAKLDTCAMSTKGIAKYLVDKCFFPMFLTIYFPTWQNNSFLLDCKKTD